MPVGADKSRLSRAVAGVHARVAAQPAAVTATMAALFLLTLTGGVWRFARGRVWEDPARLLMGIYCGPMYLLFIVWVWARLREERPWAPAAVGVDFAATALAASRLLPVSYPASGHVLFLLYTLLATRCRAYRAAAAVALACTLAAKLLWLQDALTPAAGAVTAVALWRLHEWPKAGDQGEI